MNLSRRLEKLEQAAGIGEDEGPDPVQAERERVLYDPEFLKTLLATSNAILASLSAEHCEVVERDILAQNDWYNKGCPGWQDMNNLSDFFIRMVRDTLEGFYKGPLTIPDVIAQPLFTGAAKASTDLSCEECGYEVPGGIYGPCPPHHPALYEYIYCKKCPLCGGHVQTDAYAFKHGGIGYYSRAKNMKRDSRYDVIITERFIVYILTRALELNLNVKPS